MRRRYVHHWLHPVRGTAVPRVLRVSLRLLLALAGVGLWMTATLSGCSKSVSTPGGGATGAQTIRPAVTFRVMLVDQDGNNQVAPGERVTLEVEVTNGSPVTVQDAVVVLSGSSPLSALLGGRIPVGRLEPGQQKRVAATAELPKGEVGRGRRLIVSLEVTQPGIYVGGARVFEFPAHRAEGLEAGPAREHLNVDTIPVGGPRHRIPESAAVVIGIEVYREPGVQPVPFAVHDADTMATYLDAVVGIPPDRIKIAKDGQALSGDLTELLEHWLPGQVQPGGTVVIYFSGRAFVDQPSGAVYLMPHEGQPGNTVRAVPLRRVHSVLDHLPIKQAFLWFDVSLDGGERAGGNSLPSVSWKIPSGAPDSPTVLQLVGVSNLQLAHRDEEVRHGLFTYYLLAGLGGRADLDGDGTVMAGELCDYVRDEVRQAARTVFQNEQRPLCVARLGQAAAARAIPVATVQVQANSAQRPPTKPESAR